MRAQHEIIELLRSFMVWKQCALIPRGQPASQWR